jgi:hypothetical protein
MVIEHHIGQLLSQFFLHSFFLKNFLKLFLVDNVMTLSTGDQVFFELEIEKQPRTEGRINLNHAIAEGFLVNI